MGPAAAKLDIDNNELCSTSAGPGRGGARWNRYRGRRLGSHAEISPVIQALRCAAMQRAMIQRGGIVVETRTSIDPRERLVLATILNDPHSRLWKKAAYDCT